MYICKQHKTITISAGLEPAIFCSVGRRVIHCAMRPMYVLTKGQISKFYYCFETTNYTYE